jgi:hypothetical protein
MPAFAGMTKTELIRPSLKLFLRQVLEPVSKFASMQVGVRREPPNPNIIHGVLGLRSPSLDSALRASLRLSKIAPGDFVASLTPTYMEIILRQILILTR